MAATGATELLLRFYDRLSSLATLLRVPPAVRSPLIPADTATIHFASLPYPVPPPAAASLDFIPAPQRESIVKRQRRLPAKVMSDGHQVLSRLCPDLLRAP